MAETGQQQQQEEQLILPIIDSHIHLFRPQDLPTFHWYTPEAPVTKVPHFVPQFKHAARSAPSLLGFIYVETWPKADLSAGEAGWKYPMQELELMKRVATGDESEEGLTKEDAKRCLALVPWAPVPSGPEVLETYIGRVQEVLGEEAWAKVKGFRYLVQEDPHGTMLTDEFIGSLKLLGKKGLVFDVGVDHHRRGKKQLDELIDMIERAHEGVPEDEQVTFVINHLCKPDLTIYNITSDPAFHSWRTAIYTLSKANKTYMKLSGAFSEMPDSLRTQSPSHIFQSTLGWLGIVLATFGPSRIMFGSDWPVCTFGEKQDDTNQTEKEKEGGAEDEDEKDGEGHLAKSDAWARWRDVVEKMCWMATLGDEERAMIFGGTAKKAYGL